MTPMEFTLGQLYAASQYKPQNMDRSELTADEIKACVLGLIESGVSASEEVSRQMGFSRSAAKAYLRTLAMEGKVVMTRSNRAHQPATYRLAES